MMPPTGLTFIVHILVVIVRKIGSFLGISGKGTKKSKQRPSNKRLQTTLSILVVSLVTVYIGWIVVFFVERSVGDKYANWKVIGRTAVVARKAIDERQPKLLKPKEPPKATIVKYYDDGVGSYYQSMFTAMYQIRID